MSLVYVYVTALNYCVAISVPEMTYNVFSGTLNPTQFTV